MISPVKVWRNQKYIRALHGKRGTIVSWTQIVVPPAEFTSQAPYVVVIVSLDTGGSQIGQFVDYQEHHFVVGQRVRAVIRKTRDAGHDGVIPYGIKFTPDTSS